MSITIQCAQCSHDITVDDKFAGKRARCPSCSSIIMIPATASPLAESVSSKSNVSVVDDGHHDEYEDDYEETAPLIPHKGEAHEDLIDMTPMVDIVFFLLIFFLTTSMTAVQAVMDLPTPQKASDKGGAKAAGDSASLTVKIQEDDSFWIEGDQLFSSRDLQRRIRQAREESSGNPLSLVVVGNANASHGAAIRVFDAGAAAGVASISLLVKEETED